MNNNTDIDLGENPMLHEAVEKGNPLKNFLVEYVGSVKQPKDNTVTTEMIVETMAKDFPEFLMVVAEENFMRGYHQALVDVEEGEAAMKAELEKTNSKKTKGKKKSAGRRKSKAG
jgi:hypothetical protein